MISSTCGTYIQPVHTLCIIPFRNVDNIELNSSFRKIENANKETSYKKIKIKYKKRERERERERHDSKHNVRKIQKFENETRLNHCTEIQQVKEGGRGACLINTRVEKQHRENFTMNEFTQNQIIHRNTTCV